MNESPFKKGRINEPKRFTWEGVLEKGLTKSADRLFASRAGLCYRQTAGEKLFTQIEERDASSEFYFGIGNAFEKTMEKAFKNQNVYVDSEVNVLSPYTELNVSGRIDFVLRHPESQELLVTELKSCGKLPTKPRPYQLAQLMVYLTLTGMPKGLMWYMSRNVAEWNGPLLTKVFEIEPTDEERHHTIRQMFIGSEYFKMRKLPHMPKHMNKSACGFCSLTNYCWGTANQQDEFHFDTTVTASDIKRIDGRLNEALGWFDENRERLADEFRYRMAAR